MQEEYLSQRAFAALPEVGVSHVRINKLIKEGRIPTNDDGKIPKNAGIEAWKTCRVIGFEKAGAAGKKYGGDPRKTKKEVRGFRHDQIEDHDEDDSDDEEPKKSDLGARYNKAKTLEKEWMARRRQLDYEVELGKYVLVEEVKAEASKLAAMVRQQIISVSPAIAARAEGKTITQIQRIVEEELNIALEQLQKIG